jgi:hypothetical protein
MGASLSVAGISIGGGFTIIDTSLTGSGSEREVVEEGPGMAKALETPWIMYKCPFHSLLEENGG